MLSNCKTDLLSPCYSPFCDNDDLAVLLEGDNFGNTVGVAGVVDIAGWASTHGGIDHLVVVYSEHVYASVLFVVLLLSVLSHLVPDQLTNVFDHHSVLFQVPRGKQTKALKKTIVQTQSNVCDMVMFNKGDIFYGFLK